MTSRPATIEDYDRLIRFYTEVIDSQETGCNSPEWTMGIYPSEDDIRRHIEDGEFFIMEDEEIVAAAALTKGEDPIYKNRKWTGGYADDEIGVIHLLAVHPKYRGQRNGERMLEYLSHMARSNGSKAIHLDALVSNVPAYRLYMKAGFNNCDFTSVYYDDLGQVDVNLFEYIL